MIRQQDMQVVISTHLAVHEWIAKHANRPDLDACYTSLLSWEANAELLMRTYARQFPAARWALEAIGIPSWAAAAIPAGVYGQPELAKNLVRIAGMESRRYVSPEEVKAVMSAVAARKSHLLRPGRPRHESVFEPSEVQEIAQRIGMNYRELGEGSQTWEAIYTWATRRNHSEFLRSVCMRLGSWIGEHPENHYHTYYQAAISENEHKNISLEQVKHRAKTGAVRHFLIDYFRQSQATLEKSA